MERVRVSNALQNKANPLETIEMDIIRESWDGLYQRKKRFRDCINGKEMQLAIPNSPTKIPRKKKQLNSTKELQSSVLFIGS